jgi:hypothetical protein
VPEFDPCCFCFEQEEAVLVFKSQLVSRKEEQFPVCLLLQNMKPRFGLLRLSIVFSILCAKKKGVKS